MSTDASGIAPGATVAQMIFGSWTAQAVRAMAELGLADHLASGPHTVESLASASGTHAPSLARLLHALTALNLCARCAGPDRADAHGGTATLRRGGFPTRACARVR